MTVYRSHPKRDVAAAEDNLNLGAVQIVDIVSGVVHDLDESSQRVHIVMERAPTVIADSKKLAEVTTSLLRSALDSAPTNGPIEVEVAARCLAQTHETEAGGGTPQECQALVSVAIRKGLADAEGPTRTFTSDKAGPDQDAALLSAQNIVRLHKGSLWVTTKPDYSRTFGFCLNSEQAA